jgi:hypothetical protein
MASPHESTIVSAMGFTPLELISVNVGRISVKSYPKIDPLIPIFERAHTFQVNKTTLMNLPTNFKLIIDVFSAQLNASLMVEGILSDWRQYF